MTTPAPPSSPYSPLPKIDSNDSLYGGDESLREEVMEVVEGMVGELVEEVGEEAVTVRGMEVWIFRKTLVWNVWWMWSYIDSTL